MSSRSYAKAGDISGKSHAAGLVSQTRFSPRKGWAGRVHRRGRVDHDLRLGGGAAMIRRRTKTLAIRCRCCQLWVKPRRYDPRLNRCWDCALLTGELSPVAAVVRHMPRLIARKAV